MITRALAAEIRHAPDRFIELLRSRIGGDALGPLEAIECEKLERLDVLLRFGAPGTCTVGIEAKFDHELTDEQLTRERKAVDVLVLLLPSLEDHVVSDADRGADGLAPVVVVTWAEALRCFDDSRVDASDIASLPLTKRAVERVLRRLVWPDPVTRAWSIGWDRNGSGMPTVTLQSDPLPNGRQIRGQLQVVGRSMPVDGSPVLLEYHVGVTVHDTEEDMPDPKTLHEEPGWIPPLRTLRALLQGRDEELSVARSRRGHAGGRYGHRKVELADTHLGPGRWVAAGYLGWALGVRSVPTEIGSVQRLAEVTSTVLTEWYDAERSRLRA